MNAETETEWIYPGADVVVYRDTFGSQPVDYHRTKVAKVATKSFTVETITDRIQLADLASKRLGGTWGGWYYRVIPVGSEKHYELRAARQRENVKNRARSAADDWMTKRDDPAAIDSVIAAFTALRDELFPNRPA